MWAKLDLGTNVVSYHSIKLLTKNPPMLCIQTPPKRSGVDSKPIWHLDPLLPRFIYVAWVFYSCLQCDIVPIVKGLKKSTSSEKRTFVSLLQNSSSNDFVSFLIRTSKAVHGLLLSYIFKRNQNRLNYIKDNSN